jgi:rhodanese-related sulfurtransferase
MNVFRRGPGRVTARQAAERTDHGENAGHREVTGGGGDTVLLDVREPDEWQAGHAPQAVHVSLSALESGTPLPPTAHDRPLIVICRSGNRSRRAAELLAARGAHAVDVIGGMQAWARAGLPVVDQRGRGGSVA